LTYTHPLIKEILFHLRAEVNILFESIYVSMVKPATHAASFFYLMTQFFL
jgi:hypothetical protein